MGPVAATHSEATATSATAAASIKAARMKTKTYTKWASVTAEFGP